MMKPLKADDQCAQSTTIGALLRCCIKQPIGFLQVLLDYCAIDIHLSQLQQSFDLPACGTGAQRLELDHRVIR
jgi:hypothetical protein